MADCLKITKIVKEKNRVECFYDAEGKWKELLNLNEKMFVEYDDNIEDVPDRIAIIPLLCNVLPISWVFDLTILVNQIDREFYECISNVKNGYAEMYPTIKMQGNLKAESIEETNYEKLKTATLFSGGVDAFNTLFSHIDERPILVTVWGADVKLQDEEGWNRVKNHHLKVARQLNLENSFIKSNFKTFINVPALTEFVEEKVGGSWWHEFQHGIGILGLIAPIAYTKKIATLYIASSFTARDKGKYTCASDPTIDNNLKFSSCYVVHDGYEYNRQEKIHNICQYLQKNERKSISIRVCWKTSGGRNCCECEKCYRTILGIIAEKRDPNQFGFEFDEKKRKKMMKRLPKIAKYNFRYVPIQKSFKENYTVEETPKDLVWFRKLDIRSSKPKLLLLEKLLKKTKKIVKKILRKIR